jgi:hypothetical protein
MKTTLSVITLTVLTSLTLGAQTEDKHSTMDHQKHMRVMEMMKDSVAMDMMMSLVAADRQTRTAMIQKIVEYTEGDSAARQEVCMVMMHGNGEHASEQGTACGMMRYETIQGKTGEQEKGMQGKEKQDKSHKH